MRISVYCSSAPSIEQKYLDLAFDVGTAIALAKADLVWGAGQVSMMGAVAKGARAEGAKTFGVIPGQFIAGIKQDINDWFSFLKDILYS